MNKKSIIIIALIGLGLAGAFLRINYYQDELRFQEKVNFELSTVCEKITAINDFQADKIKDLEEENVELEEKLDRILTLSSATIDDIQKMNMSETRGTNLADAMAVTQTVLDRSEGWDKTAKEVVNQKRQYASQYKGEINDTVKLAFELVYLDGYRIFEEPTTHFATYPPYWSKNKTLRGKLEQHYYWG